MMVTRYLAVTTIVGLSAFLFVVHVDTASSSFDGYYYQHPVYDNDDLDSGVSETHENEPPLLTYHEDPDERKNTAYLCKIHGCNNVDSKKSAGDICNVLGCGNSTTNIALVNSYAKRHDNATFGEILSLLKSFSFKELMSLQSNLTSKLANMKDEGKDAKSEGKNDVNLSAEDIAAMNKTANSTADQIQIDKENEHFFVSVDKFNKLLETLSSESGGAHSIKGKKGAAKTVKEISRHAKTQASSIEKMKSEAEIRLKGNSKYEPTIAEFNKLFEDLTSSRTMETLRNNTAETQNSARTEQPYGEKLLQLLYAFNNTLNSLPDEKGKGKKKKPLKLFPGKDSGKFVDLVGMNNKLPVSITTNKSLAGDVHVKVTVTLDDDGNVQVHNTHKRHNKTQASLPLPNYSLLNKTMKEQTKKLHELANMLENIGKHNTSTPNNVLKPAAGAGDEEGSGLWESDFKTRINNLSKTMIEDQEGSGGQWIKDMSTKVQNLSKSIADYSISTLTKIHDDTVGSIVRNKSSPLVGNSSNSLSATSNHSAVTVLNEDGSGSDKLTQSKILEGEGSGLAEDISKNFNSSSKSSNSFESAFEEDATSAERKQNSSSSASFIDFFHALTSNHSTTDHPIGYARNNTNYDTNTNTNSDANTTTNANTTTKAMADTNNNSDTNNTTNATTTTNGIANTNNNNDTNTNSVIDNTDKIDAIKSISLIGDLSPPPISKNLYKLKQMSKEAGHNITTAMVSDSESAEANALLSDLYKLLKYNHSVSNTAADNQSSISRNDSVNDTTTQSSSFFNDIFSSLRSNHSTAADTSDLESGFTRNDDSVNASAPVSPVFNELYRLLKYNRSSNNIFEKESMNGTKWFHQTNSQLNDLFNETNSNDTSIFSSAKKLSESDIGSSNNHSTSSSSSSSASPSSSSSSASPSSSSSSASPSSTSSSSPSSTSSSTTTTTPTDDNTTSSFWDDLFKESSKTDHPSLNFNALEEKEKSNTKESPSLNVSVDNPFLTDKSNFEFNTSSNSSIPLTVEQKWYADTAKLVQSLKKNLSHAVPSRWYHNTNKFIDLLKSNLSTVSTNRWFHDTNKFVDSLRANLSSVTLYVKGEDAKPFHPNKARKQQNRKAYNKIMLHNANDKKINSSINKFEKLLTLLTSKKFSGDKNWKHNTYLHLSITTFEDLFKSLIQKAHKSKHKLWQYLSHTDTKKSKHNRRNSTIKDFLPLGLPGNISYLDATVKFAKENGVEEQEIEKLQGNVTSDYKFRKLLKLLTFKEMLKHFHNQSHNGTVEDRSGSDVRIQASFIHKIETLLKLLAFNRIFEDWEEAEGNGEKAKMSKLFSSELGGHIGGNFTTNVLSGKNENSNKVNSNFSVPGLSNRNIVHGHYSKAESFGTNPVQVTSRVRKIYDEPVQPPFLNYGTLMRKSAAVDPLPDTVVKLHYIRKRPQPAPAQRYAKVGKITKNPIRLRSRVKNNAMSSSSKVSFFDYGKNTIRKTPVTDAHQNYMKQQYIRNLSQDSNHGFAKIASAGKNTVRGSKVAFTGGYAVVEEARKKPETVRVNRPVIRTQRKKPNRLHIASTSSV